ncbi:MAG: cobalamin-dependent protein [Candidatus Marinimicrobia bacterium]|nr:cobalamin-dependent protein [Candidatus Neomarinimicrobiota bacterium]
MARNEALFEAICKGKRNDVTALVQGEIDAGTDIIALMNSSMIPAMRDMGERFSRNEVYVPEMLIAARAMQAGLNLIEPILADKGHKAKAKVCIGTVKGDLHDIGKNLVAIMLKGAGFDVIDCGVDCDTAKFEQAVQDGAQAVLCSALLTTTMPYMKEVVAKLKDSSAKIIIGGAPVTRQYAEEIGADGYGADAFEGVTEVERLLGLTAA